VIPLRKSRQLLQVLIPLLGRLYFPCCPHQVQHLALLLFGQLVDDIAQLVIAAPLHRLIAAEHLLDRSAQRFGTINDEQVFAVRRQTLFSMAGQQAFDAGGVLCRSRFNSQDVLLENTDQPNFLLVAQRIDRIDPRSLHRRINPEDHPHGDRYAERDHHAGGGHDGLPSAVRAISQASKKPKAILSFRS
jgi:hypothetical protein